MIRYSDAVLDHFQHPRCVGRLADRDGVGKIGDASCGDFLEMNIRLTPDHQRIAAVGYLVKGCPAAIATTSILAEMSTGRTIEEAMAITDSLVIGALDGLPAGKEHCSLLSVRALHLAVQDAMWRKLLKNSGMVVDDADYERFVAAGGLDQLMHRCDGSCGAPGQGTPRPPAPSRSETEPPLLTPVQTPAPAPRARRQTKKGK